MKIAITGHTRGIGFATATLLSQQGHNVIGFCRETGWDLNDKDTRTRFIDEIKSNDFDCFINNAYPYEHYQSMEGFLQIELLNKVWLLWERQEGKKIINISSATTKAIKNYFYPFNIHKRALDDTCNQLTMTREWPHIINIKPSYVDTKVMEKLNNVNKMKPEEVADLIAWAINSPVKIHELGFSSY